MTPSLPWAVVRRYSTYVGRDRRVGPHFFRPNCRYGGSHQAVRIDTGALVALKIVLLGDNERSRQRRLEAESLTRLRHAHIAPVIDIGSEGNLDYIAMKLIQGEPIDQWVRDRQPSWKHLAELAAHIAEAMPQLTVRCGARDIKPGNVLLTNATPTSDFGIARDLNADHGLTATEEGWGRQLLWPRAGAKQCRSNRSGLRYLEPGGTIIFPHYRPLAFCRQYGVPDLRRNFIPAPQTTQDLS